MPTSFHAPLGLAFMTFVVINQPSTHKSVHSRSLLFSEVPSSGAEQPRGLGVRVCDDVAVKGVSEGLDFANRNGRAVIITGLPYPPFKDPRVMLKQKYLDEARARRKHGLTGQAWYNLEASRAVNQAVGRVIRHKDDYGAIILCDSRFASVHFKSQLSAWIRPHIVNYNKFGPVMKNISQFFKQIQILLPQPGDERRCAPMRNPDDSNPSTSLPVVASGLDRISSRPAASQNPTTSSLEAQSMVTPDECISDLYSRAPQPSERRGETETEPPLTDRKSQSIFSLLAQEVKVKPQERIHSLPLPPVRDYISIKQNTKRRKMKFVPRTILPSEGTAATEGVLKPCNPVPGVCPAPSKAVDKAEMCQPTELKGTTLRTVTEKEEEKRKKLKATGAYILEVRAAVPKEKYAVFSSAVKEYKSKSDFEQLTKMIPTVFSSDPTQQSLMKSKSWSGGQSCVNRS
ncbi:Regulator of telomere elongation helicase 1 [Chionoecetes opilio]|uniref:Regulator of telomere elongation helicase 1 n=1 Tax=Chionoecetes opilio TaxID=41210 RepID=A0A8J4XN52_CHIOP|nr:Regulator of telomere elongation helicase 1 [Chionoecetes opilio]